MPVAHGHAAVGVTFATVKTRSVDVAVPEIVLEPRHVALAMPVCVIEKVPLTVAAAGNDTLPVVDPLDDQLPVAVVAGWMITIVTSSATFTPAV
jgi:hypothetical protein